MVGHRITSVMVAQDARKGRRVLDRFGPSGGGNTLRPICGCIILMLKGGEVCFAGGFVSLGFEMIVDLIFGGMPLLPLYIRGAGLHEAVLVRYGVGVLVGYNCTSSV